MALVLLAGCGVDWHEAEVSDPNDCTEFCDRYIGAGESAAALMPVAVVVDLALIGVAIGFHAVRRQRTGEGLLDPPRAPMLTLCGLGVVILVVWIGAAVS